MIVYIYKNNCREKIYIVPKSTQSVLHPANGVGSNGFNELGTWVLMWSVYGWVEMGYIS